jgi:LmbE family N-acetylglucosaminyl deacetylase
MAMKIFLSPHSDDEVLFGAYSIMREKPLVVICTHATMQGGNGYERAMESYRAMRILGAQVMFLGIDEDELTEEVLEERLSFIRNDDYYHTLYAPEYEENGNPHHNIVANVAKRLTDEDVKTYKTYTGLESRTEGKEVIPTPEELQKKKEAMSCYQTQINNPNTAHYFNVTNEYV